jgi:hypothetical protein
MVGNWLRDRREASDCFCIELTVCAVTLDEEIDLETMGVATAVVAPGLSLAKRWVVVCSRAGTCIGGRLTGDLGFLGSTDESVY